MTLGLSYCKDGVHLAQEWSNDCKCGHVGREREMRGLRLGNGYGKQNFSSLLGISDYHQPGPSQPPSLQERDQLVKRHLPKEAKERKRIPLYTGLVKYFPDALVAVAQLSQVGNDQHNPGQPLHWAREKSTDQHDTLMRHLFEAGTIDTDGVRHSTKVVWRALAALQIEIERAANV